MKEMAVNDREGFRKKKEKKKKGRGEFIPDSPQELFIFSCDLQTAD